MEYYVCIVKAFEIRYKITVDLIMCDACLDQKGHGTDMCIHIAVTLSVLLVLFVARRSFPRERPRY